MTPDHFYSEQESLIRIHARLEAMTAVLGDISKAIERMAELLVTYAEAYISTLEGMNNGS